jgi:hypothetical protein
MYEHIGYNKNITYISVIITVSYFFLTMNSSHAKRTLAFQNDKEEIEEDSTTPFISNEKHTKTRYCEQFIHSSFQTITNFNMPYIQLL